MCLVRIPLIKYGTLSFGIALLSACVSVPASLQAQNQALTVTQSDVGEQQTAENAQETLPDLDLDSELLEQLLTMNFAQNAGDWSLAARKSLSAAQSSRDFRLAGLAASLALRAKEYEVAVTSAQLWTELQADNKDAESTLLLALLGAGNIDAAYQGFQKAWQSESPPVGIDQFIKQVTGYLLRQDNADSAIGIARLYLQAYPGSAQVALSLAYVSERFKRDELTEKWLKQALLLDPDWDMAAQMKVALLRRQGKDEESSAYILQFVNDHPKSIGMRMNYASELARQKEYQQAFSVMQAVIDDDRKNVSALSYAAALAQQLDQTEQAKKYYQQALRHDPQNDELRWTLARFAVIEKNYQRAEEFYQAIGNRKGGEATYFQAQLQVANMRYHTRGSKAAINTLRALEPRTEAQYIDRATTRHYLLLQDYQYEEAFGAINETIAYFPENTELIYARALVAAELNELETVEEDLRSIIARRPKHANALNALGYTLADQTERYAEAKELIVKALELRPNDAHILDSMGWVLYRMQDFEQAVSYLRRAYAKAPEVEVAAHLGEVLWEKGEADQAKDIWTEAFDKDTENPLLNRTLERYDINFAKP